VSGVDVSHRDAREVVDFWFAQPPAAWFRADPAFDAALRERFGALHGAIAAGGGADWESTTESTLGLVLVLDQLSRNIHRGDPRAFACDARAVDVTRRALARGLDRELAPERRTFLYMPLMHSERVADQDLCCASFAALAAEHEPAKGNLKFAEDHRAIVARFGGFPHRNVVLGRATTPEEAAFLEEPGSSF